MNNQNQTDYEKIIDRVIQLEVSMPHGYAVKLACAEFKEDFSEIGEIVSCLTNNRVNNANRPKYDHNNIERNRRGERIVLRTKYDTISGDEITFKFKRKISVTLPIVDWLKMLEKASKITRYRDDYLHLARSWVKKNALAN